MNVALIATLADIAIIIQVVVLLVGAFAAVFLFLGLSPRLDISITPQWTPGIIDLCVLKVRIENTSRIRIKKRSIKLQILEHQHTEFQNLSDFVPFQKDDVRSTEIPVEWQEPSEICQVTKYLYPGKILLVDIPVQCPDPACVKHVGLRVNAVLSRFRSVCNLTWRKDHKWTTTVFMLRPATNASPPTSAGKHDT